MFPVSVEMILLSTLDDAAQVGVPHIRGDDPPQTIYTGTPTRCSPYPWG